MAGVEPATFRLTGGRSAAELHRNDWCGDLFDDYGWPNTLIKWLKSACGADDVVATFNVGTANTGRLASATPAPDVPLVMHIVPVAAGRVPHAGADNFGAAFPPGTGRPATRRGAPGPTAGRPLQRQPKLLESMRMPTWTSRPFVLRRVRRRTKRKAR